MQAAIKKKNHKYTYQEYLTWDDDERWEIIDGEVYNMSPAPTSFHQLLAGECHYQLVSQLKGKKCTPFMAPTDVIFSDENVVQPDVFVVCDKQKMLQTHIQGAPTLIIEILSPSTSVKDKREKKELYESFGVKEYLLINPEEAYVERYHLKGKKFQGPQIFAENEILSLKSLKGLKLNLKEMFESRKIFKKS